MMSHNETVYNFLYFVASEFGFHLVGQTVILECHTVSLFRLNAGDGSRDEALPESSVTGGSSSLLPCNSSVARNPAR